MTQAAWPTETSNSAATSDSTIAAEAEPIAARPNSSPRTVLTRRESSEVTTLVNEPRPSDIPSSRKVHRPADRPCRRTMGLHRPTARFIGRPMDLPAQPRKAGFSFARNARTPSAKSGPV
jgi:hypothetical protein